MTKILLTTAEKAAELGVAKETLYRWRRDGVGPAWRTIGNRTIRYVPEPEFDENAA